MSGRSKYEAAVPKELLSELETLTASLQSNLAGPELGFDIWDLPDSNAWSLALDGFQLAA